MTVSRMLGLATALDVKMQPLSVSRYGTCNMCKSYFLLLIKYLICEIQGAFPVGLRARKSGFLASWRLERYGNTVQQPRPSQAKVLLWIKFLRRDREAGKLCCDQCLGQNLL